MNVKVENVKFGMVFRSDSVLKRYDEEFFVVTKIENRRIHIAHFSSSKPVPNLVFFHVPNDRWGSDRNITEDFVLDIDSNLTKLIKTVIEQDNLRMR